MKADELRSLQAPLKEQYRAEPAAALVTLRAEGRLGERVTCSVETGRVLVEAGLHPATGGTGLSACSGDMLLQALAACAGVTLSAAATALGIEALHRTLLLPGVLGPAQPLRPKSGAGATITFPPQEEGCMKMRLAIVSLAAFCLVPLAQAQTKVSGTVVCAKPDQEYSIPVAGDAHHVYAISHGKCMWTKPMEIAGTRTKEDALTNFDEVKGDTAHGHASGVGTLVSGDQFHVQLEGKTLLKEGAPLSSDGKWKFTGGTGAVKDVKGGGTYTCKGGPDGMTCEVSGDYSLSK